MIHDETKHTPLPWRANFKGEARCFIEGPGDDYCSIATMARWFPPFDREEQRANSYFIVRACNCHDDLLEACKRNADTFRDTAQAMRLLKHDAAAEAMSIAEDATRAAIAKAKGNGFSDDTKR